MVQASRIIIHLTNSFLAGRIICELKQVSKSVSVKELLVGESMDITKESSGKLRKRDHRSMAVQSEID